MNGTSYCECETPVMDPEHDAGCRRCGLPVNFTPQPPAAAAARARLFDIRVTPAALRAAAHVVMGGENVADVELVADERILVVTQGDAQMAFDADGAAVSADYLSPDEERLALQDDLVSGVLDVARRSCEISDWSVKAELEDGLELQVVFADGRVSLYRALRGADPHLVWTEPAEGIPAALDITPVGFSPETTPAPTAAQLGFGEEAFVEEAARVARFVGEHPQLHRDLALTGQRQRELAGRRAGRRSPFDALDRGWFITNLRGLAPPGFDYTADEELALTLVTHALHAIENELEGEPADEHQDEYAVERVADALAVLYGIEKVDRAPVAQEGSES